MSYVYRPPLNKIQTLQSSIPKPQNPVSEINKQQLKIYESVFSIIGCILKSNQTDKIKESFQRVKSTVMKKKKYSELLVKKLNYLFKQKHKQFTTLFFSSLVSNKISFYNQQMAALKQLKQNFKTRSTSILFYSIQKLFVKKQKTYFNDLRVKSVESSKSGVFKAAHLYARLSEIYRGKLSMVFGQLVKNHVNVLRMRKLFSKLQDLVDIKNKRNTSSCLNLLRSYNKLSVINKKSNISTKKQPIDKQKQKLNLQARQRKAQSQLTQLQQQQNSTLMILRNDISNLQKETQSLRFNNELLQQNNSELESQLQTLMLRNKRKLAANEIWQNVYNNLIYFLGVNKDKSIRKEQLIQAMQLPLVPCVVNLQQISEENNILSELLQQYKRSFPEPEQQEEEIRLPYELLRKENKYYYMVLQVLAEWGATGNRELDQLNKDLELLQNKLSQV